MERSKCIVKSVVCISLLTLSLACASTAKGQSTGSNVEDRAISSQIRTMIFSEPTLRSSFINVQTSKGVVSLTGAVDKAPNVRTAKEMAASIPGVVEVQEMLWVRDDVTR